MKVIITNPVQATYIFIVIFVLAIFLSLRKSLNNKFFPNSVTQELKGLAILGVIFSHVGYFLIADNRFLFPLSILAGVGVNLFLFLSGYGLVASALAKPRSISKFYSDRLAKLYIPMWICLGIFILMDIYLLGIHYEKSVILKSVLGYFNHADIYQDIDSPLWYFSLIVFYYLLFPLAWLKKWPYVSALLIYWASYYLVHQQGAYLGGAQGLWESHLLALPLGMIMGAWVYQSETLAKIFARLKNCQKVFYYPLVLALITLIAYTAYYSGVGKSYVIEERISLLTMGAIIVLFLIKKIEIRLFYIFGILSYEIYLLHWPLMYRYDILFKYLPAWLAMTLYLLIFVGLALVLQRVVKVLGTKKHASASLTSS